MTDELREITIYRKRARTWLDANLDRLDAAVWRSGSAHDRDYLAIQRTLQKKLHEAGYAGITYPVEYGGQGLSATHQRVFNEEAANFLLPDLGVAGTSTFEVCAPTMLAHSSSDLLRRFVPQMLSGDIIVCQFFSEPGAGSDLAGITTRAIRNEDRWILNGSKIWSSGADYADYGMCLARTDWDVPKHEGLTWFLVPCQALGVEIRPIRQISGDAEFCQEFFSDVDLPDADRVGEVNDGWRVARSMLAFERLAGAQGFCQPTTPGRLAPDLVAIARRAGRTGDPVARQLIAKAHVNDFVHAQLIARIAELAQSGGHQAAGMAAYGKLSTAQFQAERARIGMDIGRGTALVWHKGDDVGQQSSLDYLNGRMMAIAGGTSEMQRNGIGERVLGLPREPSFDSDKPFREVLHNGNRWTG